jgi:hypothetical protein
LNEPFFPIFDAALDRRFGFLQRDARAKKRRQSPRESRCACNRACDLRSDQK